MTAEVVRVQIDTEADFEKYRGKLAGKIVLTQPARAVRDARGDDRPADGREGTRGSGDDADPEAACRRAGPRPRRRSRRRRGAAAGRGGAQALRGRIAQFFKAEGVVALFDRGGDSDMASVGSDLSFQQQRTDGGTIFPTGNQSRGADAGTGVPA